MEGNSEDKIALFAVKSRQQTVLWSLIIFANMIKRWIWDKTTECKIVSLPIWTHMFYQIKKTTLLEFIPLIDMSISIGAVEHKADIKD